MLAAADTARVLAAMTRPGRLEPMTSVVARVLRMGRSLVFGEVQIITAGDELAAHPSPSMPER